MAPISVSRSGRTACLFISTLLSIQVNVASSFVPHSHPTRQIRAAQTGHNTCPRGRNDENFLRAFQSTEAPPTIVVEKPVVEKPVVEKPVVEKPPSEDSLSFDQATVFSPQQDNEYRRGLVTIGFITLLFSSNSPALHAAFSESSPPPVLLLNAAVSVVALVGLVFGGPILEATTPLPSSLVQNQDTESNDELKAGLELGLWKFLGTTANLYGLSLTTASHGAFLIQLTTLIVPAVQGVMGVPIPRRVQCSIALALAGVALFTQEVGTGGAVADNMALGDALCVVAAGFYATYDLRLFQWGKRIKARNLITNKIATQALFSILLLVALGRDESIQFLSSVPLDPQLIVLILWSGVAVNAIAPFLQVGGQQAVGPTRAQTLYASQPLWASIMSYFCLGETVGVQGLLGGTAFLSALFLAATAEAPDPNCGKENCEV